MGPVALGSELRCLLSGPVTKHNSSCLTTYTKNSVKEIAKFIISIKKIENFWALNSLGIQENEISAFGKVLSGREFVNNWYKVKLPLKKMFH